LVANGNCRTVAQTIDSSAVEPKSLILGKRGGILRF